MQKNEAKVLVIGRGDDVQILEVECRFSRAIICLARCWHPNNGFAAGGWKMRGWCGENDKKKMEAVMRQQCKHMLRIHPEKIHCYRIKNTCLGQKTLKLCERKYTNLKKLRVCAVYTSLVKEDGYTLCERDGKNELCDGWHTKPALFISLPYSSHFPYHICCFPSSSTFPYHFLLNQHHYHHLVLITKKCKSTKMPLFTKLNATNWTSLASLKCVLAPPPFSHLPHRQFSTACHHFPHT